MYLNVSPSMKGSIPPRDYIVKVHWYQNNMSQLYRHDKKPLDKKKNMKCKFDDVQRI